MVRLMFPWIKFEKIDLVTRHFEGVNSNVGRRIDSSNYPNHV